MNVKLFLSIAICLFTTNITYSQWVQTDGPMGVISVNGIIGNKGKLYIGTNYGLYESDSITGKSNYIENISLNVYAKKGDSLFAGSNNGITLIDLPSFTKKSVLFSNAWTINSIKQTDSCLYIGTDHGGFYKSIGFSDKWEECNNGLPFNLLDGVFRSRYVYSIAYLNDVIFCETDFGLFKTNVSPILWSPASNGIPKEINTPYDINFLKAIDETIYVGIQDKLYSSSDKGNSWEGIFSFGSTISSLNKFGNDFYVTTLGNGIYIYMDKVGTWSKLNSGLSDLNVKTLTMIDTVLICGTSNDGFYYKRGNDWVNNNEGIIRSSVKSMAITSKAIIANEDQKVYSSTDGNSWNDITPPISRDYFSSVGTMGDTILLSGLSKWPWENFIIYSDDDGNSWENLTHGVPNGYFEYGDMFSMYISDMNLYAYVNGDMYHTADLGTDWWTNFSIPNQYCNNFNGFVNYNYIPFAITCGNAELIKLNAEGKWELSNVGLPVDLPLKYLTKTNDALYVNVPRKGMYVSRDAGNSWSFTNNTLDLYETLGLSLDDIRSSTFKGSILFISTSKGVFFTDDYGQNWKSLNDGLDNKFVNSIKIFNDVLYAGTDGNGIWKYDIKNIVSSNSKSNLSYQHLRIYPNPASNYLNIQTEPNLDFTFKIVDLMGKQIIAMSKLSGGRIDISNLQNGTYIIVLNSNKGVFTEKLIIKR